MFERMKVLAKSMSGTVIEIAISIIALAILVGLIAFPVFFGVSTGVNATYWGATNVLIWGTIPVVSLAVIIIGLVGYFRHKGAE